MDTLSPTLADHRPGRQDRVQSGLGQGPPERGPKTHMGPRHSPRFSSCIWCSDCFSSAACPPQLQGLGSLTSPPRTSRRACGSGTALDGWLQSGIGTTPLAVPSFQDVMKVCGRPCPADDEKSLSTISGGGRERAAEGGKPHLQRTWVRALGSRRSYSVLVLMLGWAWPSAAACVITVPRLSVPVHSLWPRCKLALLNPSREKSQVVDITHLEDGRFCGCEVFGCS